MEICYTLFNLIWVYTQQEIKMETNIQPDFQPVPQPSSSPNKTNRFILITFVIAVLVVVAIAIFIIRKKDSKPVVQAPQQEPVKYVEQNPPAYAPKGQLVSGFPTELLAGSKDIINSYDRSFSADNKVLAADFKLDKTEKEAYDFYTKYLVDNQYVISGKKFAIKVGNGTYATMYGKDLKGNQLNIIIRQPGIITAKPVIVSLVYTPAK